MIGALAGDMIGSRFEMINYAANKKLDNYAEFELFTTKSKFTDDTVLTIAVADCIMSGKSYADAFREYGRRYPLAGYGGMFINWLDSEIPMPYNSYGNGSAMRVSPIGFYFDDLDSVLKNA